MNVIHELKRYFITMNSHREAGASLIESLIAITLLSIAGISLTGASYSAFRALQKGNESALLANQILRTDTILRKEIGKISIPYWINTSTLVSNDSEAILPWYDGCQDQTLSVLDSQDGILLETGNATNHHSIVLAPGSSSTAITYLRREDGTPIGLEVRYTVSKKDYLTKALFSSQPLAKILK